MQFSLHLSMLPEKKKEPPLICKNPSASKCHTGSGLKSLMKKPQHHTEFHMVCCPMKADKEAAFSPVIERKHGA